MPFSWYTFVFVLSHTTVSLLQCVWAPVSVLKPGGPPAPVFTRPPAAAPFIADPAVAVVGADAGTLVAVSVVVVFVSVFWPPQPAAATSSAIAHSRRIIIVGP